MKIPMFWTLLLLLTVASFFVLMAGIESPWNLLLPGAGGALLLHRLAGTIRGH